MIEIYYSERWTPIMVLIVKILYAAIFKFLLSHNNIKIKKKKSIFRIIYE